MDSLAFSMGIIASYIGKIGLTMDNKGKQPLI